MKADERRTIEGLIALGMSSYEARAYVALLAAGKELNGYEVAKRSGLPRTAVYETLAKLTARGAAFEVRNGDDAVAYVPLPGENYLARLRADFSSTVQALEESVPRISRSAPSVVHRLEDSNGVLARTHDLFRDATREVHVMLFTEEMKLLTEDLKAAHDRGVEVTVDVFGAADPDQEIGRVYHHLMRDAQRVIERIGCRLLIAVADVDTVLISAAVGDTMSGMFTNEPAVVLVALELIRHDIAIQALADRHGMATLRELLEEDPELAGLVSGHLPSLGD